MKTPETLSNFRLDRELEREREQRHKNDDAKAGIAADDDFRIKDARESNNSGKLHRSRER